MVEKINFTQAAINRLPAPAVGRAYYRDAKTHGMTLCVSRTGVKTFELYRRMGGRPTRLKIGRFPDITVEFARKEVARMTGEIAQGKDPADERRKARGETTVGELFGMYLEGHAKPHKRTWQEDQNQFNRYLVAWTPRRLSQIRKADVAALHAKIGRDHGHYAANRLLALLSAMFNHAASLGYDGGNPAHGVKKFKEQARDRFLHPDEMRAFLKALEEEPSEMWRDFFALTLLTGARCANVLAMRWTDLNLDRGLWRIPETEAKGGEPMVVILVVPVVEILRRRVAGRADGSPFVFPGGGGTGHLTAPKQTWRSLLVRAGLVDGDGKNTVRVHDLRRTLGSWAAARGVSLQMIGKVLGHKNVATTAIYARLDLEPLRAVVEATTAAIMAAGNDVKALPAPQENTPTGGAK